MLGHATSVTTVRKSWDEFRVEIQALVWMMYGSGEKVFFMILTFNAKQSGEGSKRDNAVL